MGCPAVLLFPVRRKLQSLQTSVLIGPYSVSWEPSRCRLIGLSFHCKDFAANWCLPGWVPLPRPTSCCSQSAYSAAWVFVCMCVCVCVWSPFPPPPLFFLYKTASPPSFPLPSPLSSLTHTLCFSLTCTHSWINTHTLLPHEAQQQPDVCESLEKVTSVCVYVCVCFQCSRVSAADFCFTWDRAQQDRERGAIEVHRSWIRDFAQGNDSLISCKNVI